MTQLRIIQPRWGWGLEKEPQSGSFSRRLIVTTYGLPCVVQAVVFEGNFTMYKIAIFFRKTATPNLFRDLIIKSLASDFDSYVACSAFFQETPNTKQPFSTSSELIGALSQRKPTKTAHIDAYGIYGGKWTSQFRQSCQLLDNYAKKINPNISFNFFKFKNKSHAKIFIAKENNINSLAIIGSSNLSAGAFANRLQKNSWNHESDVIFWNTKSNTANTLMGILLDKHSDQIKDSTFVTNYDDSFFSNDISVNDKLTNLEIILKDNSNTFTY